MVGRCISYWNNLFLGGHVSFRGVYLVLGGSFGTPFLRTVGKANLATGLLWRVDDTGRKRLSTWAFSRCPTWRMIEVQLKLLLVILAMTRTGRLHIFWTTKNLQSACVKDEDFCKPVSNLTSKIRMFGLKSKSIKAPDGPDVCHKLLQLSYGKPTTHNTNTSATDLWFLGTSKPFRHSFFSETLKRKIWAMEKNLVA